MEKNVEQMTGTFYIERYGDNPETNEWLRTASLSEIREWATGAVPTLAEHEGINITSVTSLIQAAFERAAQLRAL